MLGFDGSHSTALELPCLTLLRESLGFGNLRRSHAACECPISLGCCRLLLVTRRVGYCKVEPHIRPHIVLRHAVSGGIQEPEAELRICVPLRCRFLEPSPRIRVALGSRFLIPLSRPRIILRDALSMGIHFTKGVQRIRFPLRSGFLVP